MKNRIKELRKEHRISQEELATAVNVTRQTIISLENGKYNALLASGRNDHSESGEINQFQPLENSQCTSATPFLS